LGWESISQAAAAAGALAAEQAVEALCVAEAASPEALCVVEVASPVLLAEPADPAVLSTLLSELEPTDPVAAVVTAPPIIPLGEPADPMATGDAAAAPPMPSREPADDARAAASCVAGEISTPVGETTDPVPGDHADALLAAQVVIPAPRCESPNLTATATCQRDAQPTALCESDQLPVVTSEETVSHTPLRERTPANVESVYLDLMRGPAVKSATDPAAAAAVKGDVWPAHVDKLNHPLAATEGEITMSAPVRKPVNLSVFPMEGIILAAPFKEHVSTPEAMVAVGTTVELHSLSAEAGYNGRRACVTALENKETGRYEVGSHSDTRIDSHPHTRTRPLTHRPRHTYVHTNLDV
jgi:hypothetical protein